MQNQEKINVTELLLDTLRTSPMPLSTRDLGVRLRLRHLKLPDYKISGLLRNMLPDGQIEFKRNRWVMSSSTASAPSPVSIIPPPISAETFSFLNWESDTSEPGVDASKVEWIEGSEEPVEPETSEGPWGTFRKIVSYYRQCIRNEEGADASAFQNELGKRFVYLRKVGSWYPRPGLNWRNIIPLGHHLSPLLNTLPGPTSDQSLVVGYPVQAYYKEKQGEPDVAIIKPVFFFTVDYTISRDGLIVSCEEPRPEVNLGWMDYAFRRKPDQQRSFLSACGFINRWQPNDEIPGIERGEQAPSLDNLVAALKTFMHERVRQPLELSSIPDHPLHEPFKTGIYNRAVLMLAKRTRYTVTLLKELAAIEKAPADELDRTALRYIFRNNEKQTPEGAGDLLHEEIVADTIPLNAEQRRGTASLLTRDVTVITGPPGTGKSQVVSSAVVNARMRNQTVLFASRNHKAIDAVIGRLSLNDNRSLIVRTNSKNDPNLNFTFAHAIREMLAERFDVILVESYKRSKEELDSLLENRGRQASYARRVAEIGTALGKIEEQMSYLAKEFPKEMTIFLDVEPKRFPYKAVGNVIRAVHTIHSKDSNRTFANRLIMFYRALTLFPWFRIARRKLRRVPGAPKLQALPLKRVLKALLPELPILERASEYSLLRIEGFPLEDKINELSPLENTSNEVVELSKRITEVATKSIPLELDSRCGLPPGANRAELGGLRAALKAMRTGLDEGVIRAETVRALNKNIPYILQAFPCWAVTNLSVGSRIPFLAGMYELAILDEASQSDIPSAIPILYRARRVGVVGDPFQLTHASKLSTNRDTMLRRPVGLKRVEDVRFAYTETSLYDLFASTRGVEPVFLSETYRSSLNIASYSNFVFYSGRLRVATDHKRLVVPKGMTSGIHWSEVNGEVQSGGGSGCYCRDEVDEVAQIMRNMLLNNNFRGTVGVVTPFRQQANRLNDALFESEAKFYEALIRAQAHVDTAHGFQGDERDVIVFSLCAGPDMPIGSRSFIREAGNLFNVAVSRARAVLHVVGNRDWARRCGIHHVEQLATPKEKSFTTQPHGPWYPHESPWEEKLYHALVLEGLEPRPQFVVSSRRLDLALIRQGSKPLKIDIEIDGACHRNSDGTRKIDDIWRDIQIQGLGWKVMRFWTYQLRDDMAGCVDKILKAWSDYERHKT